MDFRDIFLFGGKQDKPKGYEEGQRLFELGMAHAVRYESNEAIDYYTKSIELCPNPSPYLNRANIFSKRVRHYEAQQDLLTAKKLDIEQGNEFSNEIARELEKTNLLTENYRNGLRESLIDDYAKNGQDHVSARTFCSSFGIKPLQWEYNSFDKILVEYHFFNELDNILKFDDLSVYPEASEFLDIYPSDLIEEKVNNCPDIEAYQMAENILHSFLCVFDEKDMRYIRRGIIYRIHSRLFENDI